MASPASPAQAPTPPAETHPSTITQSTTQSQSQPTIDSRAPIEALLSEPLTSLTDDGTSKRPRDHRLIHLLLAAHGITAYQERVPLQLMDFAYRYTSSVLSDALYLQQEGYDTAELQTAGKKKGNKKNDEEGEVSLAALRMSIASRLGNGFGSGPGTLPKEFLKSLADERNRVALGPIVKETDEGPDARVGPLIGGVRLPHERHCLTGMSWGLLNEWESEGEESVVHENDDVSMTMNGQAATDTEAQDERDEDEDDEGMGRMEDVFGEDAGNDEAPGDDTHMQL